MKKLLTLTAAGALLTAPASAVQKCVALNAENLTVTSSYANTYSSYWSVTFNNGITITGDGICSDGQSDGSTGSLITKNIDISNPDIYRSHCWCRMISPAVSYWVYTFWLEDADGGASDCREQCSEYCRHYVVNDTSYRTKIFSQLSD